MSPLLALLFSCLALSGASAGTAKDLPPTLATELKGQLSELLDGANPEILEKDDVYSPVYLAKGYEVTGVERLDHDRYLISLAFETSGFLDQALKRKPPSRVVHEKAKVQARVVAAKNGQYWVWETKLTTPFVRPGKEQRFRLERRGRPKPAPSAAADDTP